MAGASRDGAGSEREHNKATVRILEVLSSFASDVPAYGVTELAQALGMTKNMTYRALTTLVEQGYLMREAEGTRYRLGWRILELQNPHLAEPDFRALATPYMHRIFELTGESVSLLVRAGDHCVMIDGIETRKHGVWRVRIGSLFTLWQPAGGRAMLANDEDEAIAGYIKRFQLDAKAMWPEIETIRRRGYARIDRTAPPQMISVAFPVRDIDGRIHGTLSVGGPRDRFAAPLDQHMPELQDLVGELNQRSRLFPADDAALELN